MKIFNQWNRLSKESYVIKHKEVIGGKIAGLIVHHKDFIHTPLLLGLWIIPQDDFNPDFIEGGKVKLIHLFDYIHRNKSTNMENIIKGRDLDALKLELRVKLSSVGWEVKDVFD